MPVDVLTLLCIFTGQSGIFANSSGTAIGSDDGSTGVGKYGDSTGSTRLHKANERETRRQRPFTKSCVSQEITTEEYKFKRTTIPQFLQLHKEDPDTITIELLHDLKSFQKVILNSEKVGQRRDDMLKIMVILIKLAMVHDVDNKGNAIRILAETFNRRSYKFCFKLQKYVQTIKSEQEIMALIRLFDHILKLLPHCWEVLPVEPLKMSATNHLPRIVDDELYLSMIANYQDAQKQAVAPPSDGKSLFADDYCEYKHLSILPGTSEINEMFPPKLRSNIVEGHYNSWAHYYDTQFKLLKEDFVAPLRRGVCGFREGLRGRDVSDVRVYYNVTFRDLNFSLDGILLSVEFDGNRFCRVNWEHSKRLIYGSLLCFSCDNFETVIFASVVDRDAKKLKDGKFTVKIESNADIFYLVFNKSDFYTMIESQAHYETYYHILNSLQNAESDTMPFTEMLIESKCQNIQPPEYMCLTAAGNPQSMFNMTGALGISKQHDTLHLFDISRQECWPNVEHVQLDESQLRAMKMALTQKVSVIQGPPGTGKTYIGLKIVQALLTNRNVWDSAGNSPILVVCYTNHALDQFLEGIIEINNSGDHYYVETESDVSGFNNKLHVRKQFSIVRVGGRSQNEKVDKYNIKKFEIRKSKVPRHIYRRTYSLKNNIQEAGVDLDYKFQVIQHKAKPCLYSLIEFIAPIHVAQLLSLVKGYGRAIERIKDGLKLWLSCIDLQISGVKEKGYAKGVDISRREKNKDDSNDISVGTKSSVRKIQKNMKAFPKEEQEQSGNYKGYSDSSNADTESEHSVEPKMLDEDNLDDDAEDTVNVIGEAELAGHQRMIDQPADVFHYKSSDENHGADDDNGIAVDDNEYDYDGNDDDNENYSNEYYDDYYAYNYDEYDEYDREDDGDDDYDDDRDDDDDYGDVGGDKDDDDEEEEEDYDSDDDDDVKHKHTNAVTNNPVAFRSFPNGSFTYATVSTIDNIFQLSKHDRLRLYDFWKWQYIEKLNNQLNADFEGYLEMCKQYKEATQEEDFCVLEKADLIGMTTTGAAKYQHIIQKVKPKIVVVEEAAEVLESHIVSCLTAATQQLILIGDHKQLRPNPNDYHLACKHNLNVSLFERLIRAGIPHATLEIQHRMRPEIAGLVCPYIYPKLLNHESVFNYKNVRGVTTNMYFFDHKYLEQENDELKSHSNEKEAKLVVALCDYFLKQGYSPSQITVLTTYTGQLLKLKPLMPRSKFQGVRITAVDNFQGEENDIILLSLVRSNEKGNVGFLKIENRICVALSRAKMGFYCFGNFTLLRENCETWKDILQYLEEGGMMGSSLLLSCSIHSNIKTEIHTVDDFKNVPEGGCNKLCDVRLECGHVCKLYCHPRDPSHEMYACTQPCTKVCDNGHPCPKLCYETCPPCNVKVKKMIPRCGHTQSVPCHLNPTEFDCQEQCSKKCNEGHLCPKFCYQNCGKCEKIVDKQHPKCGHLLSVHCHIDILHYDCEYPCKKVCSTNPSSPHKCEKLCCLPCGNCMTPVLKVLPQCGHEDLVACHLNPRCHTCHKPCNRKLPCSHPCANKCGMPCTVFCSVTVKKTFPGCGHSITLPCGMDINNKSCETSIEKLFPSCKHSIVVQCSISIDEVLCCKQVHRTLPCGHGTFMQCSQDPVKIKCKSHITKIMECGHTFEGKCFKSNNKCTKLSEKTFPVCGHKIKLPCFESLPPKCTAKCTTYLLCGHRCTGNCIECHQGRMHRSCLFQMFSLPCGHPSKDPCVGIAFSDCDYKCEYSCAHRKVCTHNCSLPCNPCKEPCLWKCPHYKCSKECHEICDRPRCNHSCKITLSQCGHPCISVCGEPCPKICRICKRQKKRFQNLCVDVPDMRNTTRYIQLTCNHLFEVNTLDKLLDEQFGDSTVMQPLVCPECRKQIQSSYRYGNLIKKRKEAIERLHTGIKEPAYREQQDAVIIEMLSCFLPGIVIGHRDSLHRVLSTNLKKLPPVLKRVAKFLLGPVHRYRHGERETVRGLRLLSIRSLGILQHEIDLYKELQNIHSMCERYPNLIILFQELFSYFKRTPPSFQKCYDVSCEKQRILLMWIASNLQLVISSDPLNEDYVSMHHLYEKLECNQPKLTLVAASDHYDVLQEVAKRWRYHVIVEAKHFAPNKAVFFSGVWTICPQNHIYCEPRVHDKGKWLCPDCAK